MISHNRGFTLVELLTVIAIILLLSMIGLRSYSIFAMRSRDQARFLDLARLQNALEQYYTAFGKYPCGDKPVNTLNPTQGTLAESISGPFIGWWQETWEEEQADTSPISGTNMPAWYATLHTQYPGWWQGGDPSDGWEMLWNSCPGFPVGGLSVNGFLETSWLVDPLHTDHGLEYVPTLPTLEHSYFYAYVVSQDRQKYLLSTNLEYFKDLESEDGGRSNLYYEVGPGLGVLDPVTEVIP